MVEKQPATWEELQFKLDRLKDIDRHREVFGASRHRYESRPVSSNELERVESSLGVCLPADYRCFLQVIGYGAGPYYGLFGPDEISSELEMLGDEDFDTGLIMPAAPSRAFPFGQRQVEECWRIMREHRPAQFLAPMPADGCMPICHEGCNFYTYLVTAGELIGSLWSHNIEYWDEGAPAGHVGSWNLAPEPPSILDLHTVIPWEAALSPLPTFLEWYQAWLDRCLTDFAELQYKQK